jgi:acetoin utilization protein AcuB
MIRSTVKTVAEIMSRKVLVAHPDHEFLPLCRLFLLMNIHHLPVVDQAHRLIGILSANDVLKAMSFRLPTMGKMDEQTLNERFPVLELMTPQPIETLCPEDRIEVAVHIFATQNISCLPVLEGEELVGIVTSRDLLHMLDKEEWTD